MGYKIVGKEVGEIGYGLMGNYSSYKQHLKIQTVSVG